MIRCICIIPFLLAASRCAAQPADTLDSVLGVPWGSAPSVARAILLSHEGIAELRRHARGTIEFAGGRYEERPVKRWLLWFDGKKLATVTIMLDSAQQRFLQYAAIRRMLNDRLGAPTSGPGPATAPRPLLIVWELPNGAVAELDSDEKSGTIIILTSPAGRPSDAPKSPLPDRSVK